MSTPAGQSDAQPLQDRHRSSASATAADRKPWTRVPFASSCSTRARPRVESFSSRVVHGGGFYNSQKYAVAPARHPEKIHWFKWEAYTTWLSGTALLVIVYWMRAQAMMGDTTVSGLTPA